MPDDPCPLTPALRRLLEASVREHTTDTMVLAEALGCSPETIRSAFKRLFERLNAHSRTEAVLLALERGWIALKPLPPPNTD